MNRIRTFIINLIERSFKRKLLNQSVLTQIQNALIIGTPLCLIGLYISKITYHISLPTDLKYN